MPEKQPNDSYRVQALERTFNIIDCFSQEHPYLSINEIVDKTGLNIATARRLINNLKSNGYLQFDGETSRYQLGLRLAELGCLVLANLSLRKVARPYLENLVQQQGASVLLCLFSENTWAIIDKVQGYQTIAMPSNIGTSYPITFGLGGKIYLATLPDNQVQAKLEEMPLASYTPYSVTDTAAYIKNLTNVRKNGYAKEVEEYMEGLMGLSTAIKNAQGRTIAFITIGLPAKRNSDKTYLNEAVDRLKNTSAHISSALGNIDN